MMKKVAAILLILSGCLAMLSAATGQDCRFGVDDPSFPDQPSCQIYDLSSLQNEKGYNTTDQDSSQYDYVLNICGNVAKTALPPSCKSLPASPVYQLSKDKTKCYFLGLLKSQITYPVDPNNATTGVRVVYYNGENVTAQGADDVDIDYGNLGIGDEERGYVKPQPRSYSADESRAVVIDFICDPNAGVGYPEPVYSSPPLIYRVTWRSAKACPVEVVSKPCPAQPFQANWQSLSFRPVPAWYDDVKFGIFIHWGVFSVPSFKTEWYWRRLMQGEQDFVEFHNRVYGCSGVQPEKYPCTGERFSYADFTSSFHAEMFDPDEWAALFKNSGAKYVVLTSKHHEGFTNFPSAQHWNWNSVDVGPHRDLVGNLSASVRAAGLHMGLYHSLREWYNPLFLEDNENDCKNPKFVDEVLMPTLKDMTLRYKPEIIWADGPGGDNHCSHDSVKYWKAPDFLQWLYNDSPVKDTVLVNNRWGKGSGGDYLSGPDRWSPGKRVPAKWESCYTIQQLSWGFDRTENITMFWDATSLIQKLVETVSCNGNLLLNVGPTADGRIVPAFQERLLQIGDWLKVNGDAIYGTKPWRAQNDTDTKRIWYTQSKTTGVVYATFYDWPSSVGGQPAEVLLTQVKNPPANVTVQLLGVEGNLHTRHGSDGLHITVPDVNESTLSKQRAWAFAITGLL